MASSNDFDIKAAIESFSSNGDTFRYGSKWGIDILPSLNCSSLSSK